MRLCLALPILYLGGVNLVFGVHTVTRWAELSRLPLSFPLAWLVAGKLAWGLVFGLTAWGVWQLRPWGRSMLLAAVTLYQVHIWLNHFLFDVSEFARREWPFAAGVSFITLGLVWGGMFLAGIRRRFK